MAVRAGGADTVRVCGGMRVMCGGMRVTRIAEGEEGPYCRKAAKAITVRLKKAAERGAQAVRQAV